MNDYLNGSTNSSESALENLGAGDGLHVENGPGENRDARGEGEQARINIVMSPERVSSLYDIMMNTSY